MSYAKNWPVWSERTGQAGIVGATDPYDDAVRMLDFALDPVDPATLSNYPAGQGSSFEVFPFRANPLRKVANGIDFSPFGYFPRRLNNRITDGAAVGGSADATLDPNYVPVATAYSDQPYDINLWNSGYRTWVRIGWNVLVSYFHFSAGTGPNTDPDLASWLARDGNKGVHLQPYFLCKDGQVRQYDLVMDTGLMEAIEAEYEAANGVLFGEWYQGQTGPANKDFCFARFAGDPPSEDEISIAKVWQVKTHLGIKQDYAARGWGIDPQYRVVPMSTHPPIEYGRDLNRNNYKYYLEPRALWSGDSGTPCFMQANGGPVWIGNASSFSANFFNQIDDEFLVYVNTAIATNAANHTDPSGKLRVLETWDGLTPAVPQSSKLSGPIKPKRTEVAGRTPTADDIEAGEIAVNSEDQKIFTKKSDGTIVEVAAGGVVPIERGGTGATSASTARAAIGADDAANLTTGNIAAARVGQINITALKDVSSTLDKGANNILYTNGTTVVARAPSNWSLTDFTNDLTSGDLPAHTHAASEITSGSLSIDLIPSADLTYSIGTEAARWADIHGDLDGAVTFRAKNASGGTLTVGDIVYISGVSGSTPTVDLADCSDPAKMPAFGMVKDASIGPNAETHIVTLGSVESVDVPSGTYTLGSNVYVGTAGTFTDSPPTGEGNLIQNIGWVARVNTGGGPSGIIKVGGAGRTNAVPNLNSGNIFYGNGSNQATSVALTSVAAAAGHTHALGDLSDVDTVGATTGQVLEFDGADWVAATPSGGTVVDRTQMPTSSSVVYLFDDFLGSAPDFARMGTSGTYWEHCLQNSGDDFCGATRWRTNAALYGRGIIQVMPPYSSAAAGQEWLWQLRVKIIPHASETILGMNVSAFCPKADLNDQTTEQGSGYGDTAKAGLTMRQDFTYWQSFVSDNEGTNGNTTKTNTTVATASDTWFVVGIHAAYDSANTKWVITSYLNGTQVAQDDLTTGTYPPTAYFSFNQGAALVNYGLVDWVSFQYTRPSSASHLLDIADL